MNRHPSQEDRPLTPSQEARLVLATRRAADAWAAGDITQAETFAADAWRIFDNANTNR